LLGLKTSALLGGWNEKILIGGPIHLRQHKLFYPEDSGGP
jgi:hypothetical protein